MSDFEDQVPEPAGLDGLPAMYSIFKGEVASVQKYGAFVKLPGYRKQGLVHVSEMSASRVESASEIVDVGEQVWIKVIGREIRDEKVKLSFSMKAVNQGTGRDLDPNNVMAEQDARRRRMFRDHTGQRITLEAVFNTICKNCGCKGHFAKDCFSAPGLQYALVPEEGDEEEGQQQQQQQPPSLKPQEDSQKKKKKKKEKKVKKKRKRERKESESDSSSSSEGPSQTKRGRHDPTQDRDERKKKKKHKKHKSHKHS